MDAGTEKRSYKTSKLIDLTGQRFGRWVVISKSKFEKGKLYWLCQCDCGTTAQVDGDTLRRGTSTGCIKCKVHHSKHNLTSHPLYWVLHGMIERCENINVKSYENYGGRGIKVCDDWHEFMNFYNWAISRGYSYGLSIDRINNDGNYCPENCRWVTMKVQQNNKRTNHILEFKGKSKTLTEWATILGIKPSALTERIKVHGVRKSLSIGAVGRGAKII